MLLISRWLRSRGFESKTKRRLKKLEEMIMSVRDELLEKVSIRKGEVDTIISELRQKVTELEAKIASGESVSSSELQEIKDAIDTIGNV